MRPCAKLRVQSVVVPSANCGLAERYTQIIFPLTRKKKDDEKDKEKEESSSPSSDLGGIDNFAAVNSMDSGTLWDLFNDEKSVLRTERAVQRICTVLEGAIHAYPSFTGVFQAFKSELSNRFKHRALKILEILKVGEFFTHTENVNLYFLREGMRATDFLVKFPKARVQP